MLTRIQGLRSAATSADAEAAEEAQGRAGLNSEEQIELEQDAVMAPLQELLSEYSSRRAGMAGAGAGEVESTRYKNHKSGKPLWLLYRRYKPLTARYT